MKRLVKILAIITFVFSLSSCACECINCPGYGALSGSGSDDLCREQYEASGAAFTLSWQNYATDLVNNGTCTCIE